MEGNTESEDFRVDGTWLGSRPAAACGGSRRAEERLGEIGLIEIRMSIATVV